MSNQRLPGQKPDEDVDTYLARIEARVQEKLAAEGQVPDRFSTLTSRGTFREEHPIYRTTNNDYGAMDVSEYERPSTYKTVSRQFTEKQHLGINFEHGGFNL